ncbi:hypothetical protein L2E82_29392 [Cichorium intybus]|uniref:Uncharacterized protein n=1 Tax=Cichorium intybus TaxID=13427 RepID=A0ACB9CXL4_CICIN|nr:hypothetical protein L2E82_29392 [Cichorium intybus]
MQGGDEEEDPFLTSDEDSQECNSEQGGGETHEDSVVQETCWSALDSMKESATKEGTLGGSIKDNNLKQADDPNIQKMGAPQMDNTTGVCPNNSPIVEKEKEKVIGISGKLKILLSKNIPISDKLVDEEEASTNRRCGDTVEPGKDMNRTMQQAEPRITRSQSRLFSRIDKGTVKANSINSSSENTELSFNVIQRMEEIGASCGLSIGKKKTRIEEG